MPNRIIKESIRTSRKVNRLGDFEFRLWLYLITYVDDYGRGSADPELLKGLVFPRRGGVTEEQIGEAMACLENGGLIVRYEAEGESYFYFPSWGEHQRIQTKRSRFPEPSFEETGTAETLHPGESAPLTASVREFRDAMGELSHRGSP